jgi:predicted Zn finger-like uncharacterized protein
MIVECEKCGGKFKLDDSKVTEKGIKVRCSKCKHVFTVKKPSSDLPEFSMEGPPSEDPFQDFSFSDDIDLGGESGQAPKGAPDSTERAPAPPPTSGNDISFADEDAGAPAPAEGKSEAAPPDDFSDFDFDEESFDATAHSPPPGESPGASESEWGNVSISDEMPRMPEEGAAPGPKDDFDFSSEPSPPSAEEESFGDFKFDNEGQVAGLDLDTESDAGKSAQPDLGRSDRSAAPVRDELEASLDTDAEAAVPGGAIPARREEPARPVIRHAAAEPGRKPFGWIIIVLLLLAAIGGGLFYLNQEGTFTFEDLKSGNFSKLKDVPVIQKALISLGFMEEPDIGVVEVVEGSTKAFTVPRSRGGNVLAVTGQVRNTFRKDKSFIQVEVKLFDEDGEFLTGKKGYCDVTFDAEELATLSRETIEVFMGGKTGRKGNNVNIQQGGIRDFTVVFFNVPPGVKSYKTEVVGYTDADAL